MEISFSLSPLKQKRWLNRFVLLPFAKLLRYEMSDFHGLKYKSKWTWNHDPVHSMHTNVTWKTTVSRPRNRAEDLQNCQKIQKKLVADVWKIPKPHWNAFEWLLTLSLATRQFPEVQLNELSKKYGVFSRNAAKKFSLKKKSKCFRSKWCINMLKKPFSFWQNVVFTDETRVRLSSDGIVRVFRRNGTRFLEKKHKKFEFGQSITYVLGYNTIRSDANCLLSVQAS